MCMCLQSRKAYQIPLEKGSFRIKFTVGIKWKKVISGIVFLGGTAIVLRSIIAVDLFYFELISNLKTALVSFVWREITLILFFCSSLSVKPYSFWIMHSRIQDVARFLSLHKTSFVNIILSKYLDLNKARLNVGNAYSHVKSNVLPGFLVEL